MNGELLTHNDVIEELQALAAAAAPAIRARPDLAQSVLDKSKASSLRRRSRRAGILVGGGLLILATAAATRPGSGSHFDVVQPSSAMAPTVQVGDHVTFSKRLEPRRGDVVYANIAAVGFDHRTISRVVALAGDTVVCPAGPRGGCEQIVVNGTPVVEPHLGAMLITPFPATTVPPASLYLLGDNRSNATDSRSFGPVSAHDVSGVGVSVTDGEGNTELIPGAPSHPVPQDSIDPAGPPQAPAVDNMTSPVGGS